MGCQEQQLIEKVCDIYDKLSRLENLNPSKQVNSSLRPACTNVHEPMHVDITELNERDQAMSQVPKHIAFVGSGPLPLTSIILATDHLRTTCFHNFDIDPSANAKAIQLVSSDSELSKRMFFHTADIMNVSSSFKQYEVVFLAALVGMDKEEKVRVIKHLSGHMAHGALLLLRSANGARAFLYPFIDPCHDLQGFEVLSVFHPRDDLINSVIIARKNSQG
uniref:Nicotianamine synthase n=1 Tax=Salix viminalis TaxID=40686 RepID=A0A6N2MT76_SALVM